MSNSKGNYKIETKSFCEVCGDKARGCNFDAITCASCKEFFRRNAFKEKGLKCYFQGNCKIDIVSRRFCASCRLHKCFDSGMKREYIMSEEERVARKSKIIEKRQLRDLQQVLYAGTNSFEDAQNCPSPVIPSDLSPQLPEGASYIKDLFRDPQIANDLNFDFESNSILDNYSADIKKAKTVTNLVNSVKLIRESNYYPIKYALLCRAKNTQKQLSHQDKHKIKKLTCVVQLMQAETVREVPKNEVIDFVKMAEILTRMLIKMCKKLEGFQNLTEEDQIALVKGGCMETLILRAIMAINIEKECWETLDLERSIKFSFKMETLKQANEDLYKSLRKYALSFEPEWRFDDNLMSLLIAIALFCPDRPNLINREKISGERQSYINLLINYLETLYDNEKAQLTFNKLMEQLQSANNLTEIHVRAYFDLTPSEIGKHGIGHLLMEIFDFNS